MSSTFGAAKALELLAALVLILVISPSCNAAPAGGGDAAQTAPAACAPQRAAEQYAALRRDDRGEAHRLLTQCHETLANDRPAGWAAFATLRARYLIDTEELASDVAAMTVPEVDPAATFIFEYANGFVAIRRGRLPDARAALSKMEMARQTLAARADDPDNAYRQVMRDEIGIMLGAAEGAVNDGIRRLERLADVEAALPRPAGPPSFGKPTSELLGEMYLDVLDYLNARRAYEKALERTPGRVPALAGLMKAASLNGDERTRSEVQAQLDAIRKTP